MKKIYLFFAVLFMGVGLAACGSSSQNANENRIGYKVSSSLKEDKNGFYRSGQALLSVNDKKKVVSATFPFKKDSSAIAEDSALDYYRKVTQPDLKHVSGSVYYSKKVQKYYHVDAEQQSDGRIVRASVYAGK
ncbi:hypothetical protein [Lactobacillus selangorensis]|uniref:hypothetical protein n=1 Tax=Lactobacillus selangorensis TaxID=81857 RepID=UPI00070D0C7D|nr:hypothetical protein [Lactobacillus selangorensis]